MRRDDLGIGFATDEGSAFTTASVLSNDEDEDAGDSLTITEVDGGTAVVGAPVVLSSGALVTLNADGTFDYDPNGSFEGLAAGESANDSFDYTISDGNGGFDTATVTITVNGANDAPVAADDGFETPLDVQVSGQVLNDNGSGADSDPDGSDVLTITEVNGSVGCCRDSNHSWPAAPS